VWWRACGVVAFVLWVRGLFVGGARVRGGLVLAVEVVGL